MAIAELYFRTESLTSGAVGLVLLYISWHLLTLPRASKATRYLGLSTLAGAVNNLCLVWLKSSLELDQALNLGGVSRDFVALFLMFFAYHLFEDDRPRERRAATWVFVALVLAASARFIWVVSHAMPIYNPFMEECRTLRFAPGGLLNSPWLRGVFRNLLLVTYGWVLIVLVRKWFRFEGRQRAGFVAALLRPTTLQGRALRKYSLMAGVLFLLPVATLVGTDWLRPVLRLFVTCAVVLVHIDHSQEPTRLRFKLVAIPLAGVVGVLSLLLTQVGMGVEERLEAGRQIEVTRIRGQLARLEGTLDSAGIAALAPDPGLRFVLVRPDTADLWQTEARLIFAAEDLQLDDLKDSNRLEGEWRERFSQKATPFYLSADKRFYGALLPASRRYTALCWQDGDHIYEAGWSERQRRAQVHAATGPLGLATLITLVFMIVGLPLLFRSSVLKPIGLLMDAVERVGRGNLESRVETRTSDEFGRLAQAFNGMVRSVNHARQALERSRKAAFRFVPLAILKQLGHESIVGVELGDQRSCEMAVLFADVRSFTSLAETMSPDETFAFVNGLLAEVGPVIREHGGFIDKYLGDAVMALFPRGCDDAAAAAVAVLAAVERFNAVRRRDGKTPIRLGIGVHTGQLTLGIIGERQRIEATVIADVVNTASRLEGLTKRYRAGILISGETRQGLTEAQHCRFVERVRVKGRAGALDIYEIFAGDADELKAAKASSAEALQAGWQALTEGRFEQAVELFGALVERCPEDPVPRLHLERARQLVAQPPPADWDGVVRMESK